VLNDGINSYAWNAESETKTAQGVTYTYDGLGNRVEKSNGTLYWYGPGGEVLDETSLTGSLTNEYVFFAGKRVARRDASGNIYYYAEDFIGSSRVITQSNGTLCSDADFLPFGQEVDFTSACGQNYKFEGKERDIETGNDNFGARYYRSALGRWMSPDWSAIPAPVPYANLTNPQTLNLYAMTSDNPETFADLDGHTGGILEMIAEEGGFGPDIITGSDAYTDGTDTVISLDGSPPPVPILPTTPPQSPTGVTAQQQRKQNRAVNAAYGVACSHSVQGCTAGQHVQVRYVGFTYNVQIPGDRMDPKSLPKGATKDPGITNKIFHKGAADSYYLTSRLGLFGAHVPHVVNLPLPGGVEAHIDHFGPLNPLHWGEAALSLFINTRADAGAGVPEVCSPTGGCQ